MKRPVTTSRIWSSWLSLAVLYWVSRVGDSTTQAEVNKHLEMGREMLNRGQYADALSHYHAALEGDPDNYLTHFKRATVYLGLLKPKFALRDLDKVLELKPDFTAARLSRGNAHLKQADLDKAIEDFEQVLEVEPYNEEADRGARIASQIRHDIDVAQDYLREKYYAEVIQMITKILEVCPWAAWLRELRADCHVALGDTRSAISDIRSATKLQADDTQGHFKLAHLYYDLGEAEQSLGEIRECLKLDPEHKDCFPFYKKVKKVDKLLQDLEKAVKNKDYTLCVDVAKKVLKAEQVVPMVIFLAKEKLCHCYLKSDQVQLCIDSCGEALSIREEPRVLCDRAECYINNEMFDEAIHDYHKAMDIDESFTRAKEGIQRAQKLQRSEGRDYYKILGVGRTASKQEIVKAYRKQAQKWHPDSFQGEEKKKAEKKFIDIAAAKEVLTDPEKRRKFDNGEDPLDPESQNGRGFNPFQFHQFHGSPFQFKFHFN